MPAAASLWGDVRPDFGYAWASHGRNGVEDEFACGDADVATRTAFTATTRVNCGSVAKLVTAYLVTRLWPGREERQRLRIADVLPGLPGPLGQANLEGCLTHTTGLWDFRSLIPLLGERSTFAYEVSDALEIAVRQTEVAPGYTRQYSNTNYLLLGLAVERVAGVRLQDLMVEWLGADVGAIVTAPRVLVPGRARGYEVAESGEVLEFGSFVDGRGSTNFWANSRELATLVARVTDGYTRRPDYGGLVLNATTFYAAGQDGGFRAGALLDVESGRCHVVVTNNPVLTPPEILEKHADVRVSTPATAEAGQAPVAATDLEPEVAGEFACASLGVDVSVERAGEKLVLGVDGRELGRLMPTGAGVFSDGHLEVAVQDGALFLSVNHAKGIPLTRVAS